MNLQVSIDIDFSSSSSLKNEIDDRNRSIMIVATATHKTRTMFFFLIQTEQGDIFKVTLKYDTDNQVTRNRISLSYSQNLFSKILQVTEILIKYFDTVPVASTMCVLRTGLLFLASEFGNQ